MKHLTLITHTDLQKELIDQLRNFEEIEGYTLTHVEGHGIEAESDPFLSARDKVVGCTPRVRADILLQDKDIDTVLDILCDPKNSFSGSGIYWVTPVEKEGHL